MCLCLLNKVDAEKTTALLDFVFNFVENLYRSKIHNVRKLVAMGSLIMALFLAFCSVYIALFLFICAQDYSFCVVKDELFPNV